MNNYDRIILKKDKIAIIGLGYVGVPIAVAFSKKADVIGFDINESKINMYKSGIDPTNEVGDEAVSSCSVEFTCKAQRLKDAKFHIVAVPTPIKEDKTPDLYPIMEASKILGQNITKGSIVVYESTVFPGVTEEVCIPIIEIESGLKCGNDFRVGYSPERINPGDKTHRLENIVKIVSGMDSETLDIIAKVYELVVEAGVYKAESIKIAEAAKVIENSQRDINIAFMNELSIIFNKMGIDTKSVLLAAETKWNFMKFYPGLVGGHCIGVDPYYLTYKAGLMGYHSQVILAGRRINDNMSAYIVENLIKNLVNAKVAVNNAKIVILGFTFKENCPDTRNTRVIDIINELREYGIEPIVADPMADKDEVLSNYGIEITDFDDIKNIDALVIAINHKEFMDISLSGFTKLFKSIENERKIFIDVKGILNRDDVTKMGYRYWRL